MRLYALPPTFKHLSGYQLKAGQAQSLTVRPELRACRAVEGWTAVHGSILRQAQDSPRTDLKRPALSW